MKYKAYCWEATRGLFLLKEVWLLLWKVFNSAASPADIYLNESQDGKKTFQRVEFIFTFTFYKRINPFCSLLEMNYISDFTQEKYVFLFYFVSWWSQQKIIFTVIIAILQNTQRIYPNKIFENDIYSLQIQNWSLSVRHVKTVFIVSKLLDSMQQLNICCIWRWD